MKFYGVNIRPQIVAFYNILYQLTLLAYKNKQEDAAGVYVNVGIRWLSNRMEVSERTISRWINELERNNLIRTKNIGQGHNMRIYVDMTRG